jgi:hypothetical protein
MNNNGATNANSTAAVPRAVVLEERDRDGAQVDRQNSDNMVVTSGQGSEMSMSGGMTLGRTFARRGTSLEVLSVVWRSWNQDP